VPCAKLSWPFRQLSSARKYIVYRIVLSAVDACIACQRTIGSLLIVADDAVSRASATAT